MDTRGYCSAGPDEQLVQVVLPSLLREAADASKQEVHLASSHADHGSPSSADFETPSGVSVEAHPATRFDSTAASTAAGVLHAIATPPPWTRNSLRNGSLTIDDYQRDLAFQYLRNIGARVGTNRVYEIPDGVHDDVILRAQAILPLLQAAEVEFMPQEVNKPLHRAGPLAEWPRVVGL